jgi:prepilin-type N-terminal cleavage/methylation domain-containing protein
MFVTVKQPPAGRDAHAWRSNGGFSLLELLLVVSIAAVATGVSVGALARVTAGARSMGAARFLALRLGHARHEAVRRGTSVGYRFTVEQGVHQFQLHVDGNGNGLLSADVLAGIDTPIASAERLDDNFRNVRFAIVTNVPPADQEGPALSPGADPIRIGSSNWVSFAPGGTGSSGTLYLSGEDSRQLAVRIFGPTGRLRVLEFMPGSGAWLMR